MKPDRSRLIAANGEKLRVEGQVDLRAEANGVSATINALVSSCIKDEALISWRDLMSLQIIPRGFPNVIAKVRTVTCKNTKKELMEEFPDVLSDELSEKPMNTDEPMKINLTANAIPKKVTTARRVPLKFEEEAGKVVEELIQKGIITRVDETTDWCSPAFFVPKGDKIRVRLVTDYTELNKSVKRPVHPFPSTKEILQSIPADAKFFCKMDAVHGYFQLGLDEESSKLTTFLLPQGKFRYKRAPMGLNASSDEWCCRSDKDILGLKWAKKIVDDI